MAKRILKAQLSPCNCTCAENHDHLFTQENLAITPQRVKDLTDRGIAVNLPNSNQFLNPSDSTKSWNIEPQFKRDANMAEMWETEQLTKRKVSQAHKKDKQKYG